MSTKEPSMSDRPVRKQKQVRDVGHVLLMWDDSASDLDLAGFDVSASTESENEVLPLTQLPATTASTSAPTVLPTVTADRRAATLPANKCVIYVFYTSCAFTR